MRDAPPTLTFNLITQTTESLSLDDIFLFKPVPIVYGIGCDFASIE